MPSPPPQPPPPPPQQQQKKPPQKGQRPPPNNAVAKKKKQPKPVEKRRVVVVGAGASARQLIHALRAGDDKKELHITVVQANQFVSFPCYQTLALTNNGKTFQETTTFQDIPSVDATIHGCAISVADGCLGVQLPCRNAEQEDEIVRVLFDTLVAATGFSLPILIETPGQSAQERHEQVVNYSQALLQGGRAVIAGGGSSAIELAGAILEKHASTHKGERGCVTLVCASDRLLPNLPEYYGERCRKQLEAMGCQIFFKERVQSHKESFIFQDQKGASQPVTLESGLSIQCHVYVAAYARGPNTGWLAKRLLPAVGSGATAPADQSVRSLPPEVLNEAGQVIVNDSLQCRNYGKLYALMACNNRQDPSNLANTEIQAKVVADSILNPGHKRNRKYKSNILGMGGGLTMPLYQTVGHDTFAMLIPEGLPIPKCCSTICFGWCGFPCNMLCPCFAYAVLFGPVDSKVCGYCCRRPEGQGVCRTMANLRNLGHIEDRAGYPGLGLGKESPQEAPLTEKMKRA